MVMFGGLEWNLPSRLNNNCTMDYVLYSAQVMAVENLKI